MNRPRHNKPRGRTGPETAGDAVTLKLTSLAHGGEAVGHHEGMAVFVQGGVPGDVVKASLQVKGRFARGRLLEVLEPAPGRLASDCRLHPACGGCPWMEVPAAVALAGKADILRDAFLHIARMPLVGVEVRPPVGAPSPTRYRHRARLHAERAEGGRVLGFLPARGRGVIQVDACAVLEIPLEKALPVVANVLRRAPEGPLDVTLSCEPAELGGRVAVCVETEGPPDEHRWKPVANALWNEHGIPVEVTGRRGVIFRAGPQDLHHAVAPDVAGGPYTHDASCFTQGNRAQNLVLRRLVMEGLKLGGDEHVLELHAGCGNFTLPVAQQCRRVTSVESHPRGVEHARRNVEKAGLSSKIRVVMGDAEHLPTVRAAADQRVDALLLDPPRTGSPGLAPVLGLLKPRRVVYVSCNPATLARDVAQMRPLGYQLKSVQAVDLFPRTWHVEAVVVLEADA